MRSCESAPAGTMRPINGLRVHGHSATKPSLPRWWIAPRTLWAPSTIAQSAYVPCQGPRSAACTNTVDLIVPVDNVDIDPFHRCQSATDNTALPTNVIAYWRSPIR